MLPRYYIIGILVFALFVTGGLAMVTELQETNGAYVDDEKLDEFNKTFGTVLYDVNQSVSTLEGNIVNAEEEWSTFGGLNALVATSWQTLKFLTDTLSFMSTALYGISTFFGIPEWVMSIVVSIIIISIIFAVYSAIFQRNV
jgi:hypothetical protein